METALDLDILYYKNRAFVVFENRWII